MNPPFLLCLAILLATLAEPAARAQQRGGEGPIEAARLERARALRAVQERRAARLRGAEFDGAVGNAQRPITVEAPIPPAPVPGKAQFEDEEAEDGPAEKAPPLLVRKQRPVARPIVERENFDRWLYEGEILPFQARERLELMLEARLNEAVRGHPLAEADRAKLRLAGRGDIKRFFDRVEAKRADFEAVRDDYELASSQLRKLRPLSIQYQHGPFGADSLFIKTLWTIVDPPEPAR